MWSRLSLALHGGQRNAAWQERNTCMSATHITSVASCALPHQERETCTCHCCNKSGLKLLQVVACIHSACMHWCTSHALHHNSALGLASTASHRSSPCQELKQIDVVHLQCGNTGRTAKLAAALAMPGSGQRGRGCFACQHRGNLYRQRSRQCQSSSQCRVFFGHFGRHWARTQQFLEKLMSENMECGDFMRAYPRACFGSWPASSEGNFSKKTTNSKERQVSVVKLLRAVIAFQRAWTAWGARGRHLIILELHPEAQKRAGLGARKRPMVISDTMVLADIDADNFLKCWRTRFGQVQKTNPWPSSSTFQTSSVVHFGSSLDSPARW
jgi:hypothetical protein